MISIGISGGIGSGKSEVCRVWESLGAYVLDSDNLAKKLMESNPILIKQIKKHFGDHSYHQDGSIDREFLAREAFEKGRVDELNALVHPVLWQHSTAIREEAKKAGYPVFVQEAAILLNNPELLDRFDTTVRVVAPRDERIRRVMARSSLSEKEIRKRMEVQNTEQPDNLFGYTLVNDSDLRQLESKATELYRKITQLPSKPNDS